MLVANLRKHSEAKHFLCRKKENNYSQTLKSLKKLSREVGNIISGHRVSASPHGSPLSMGTLCHILLSPRPERTQPRPWGCREPELAVRWSPGTWHTVTTEESAKDRKVGRLWLWPIESYTSLKSPSPRLCLVPHENDRNYQTGTPTSPLTNLISLLTSALVLSPFLSTNGWNALFPSETSET